MNSTNKKMEEKRQKILECALLLFVEKGYINTAVREIIDASGFGTSTFYRHFSNKEDVLKTLLADFIDQIIARVNDYFRREDNLYLRFIETKQVIIEVFAENSRLSEIYSRVSGISDSIDSCLKEFDDKFLDFTTKNIEYGIKKGIFRDLKVSPIVHGTLGIIKYAVYKWVVLKEITVEEMMEMVMSFHQSLAIGIMENKDARQ
jgi:AcrR family transcriptional regulator